MKAWMRVLGIKLTSKKWKKSMTFGLNDADIDLNINCTVHKYMSTLKDTATIKINNLTYDKIIEIIKGEFYDIDILCGYKNNNISNIFSGGMLYISNQLNSDRTNTLIILCGSKMLARYGQSRINLTLNSGINMYSAIEYVCRRAGMPNSNISTQFKRQFLTDIMTINSTATSWIDELCKQNNSFIVNSDGTSNQTFSIFDSKLSNGRVIPLKKDNISLSGGVPRMTTDGLELTLLPTFGFMCGDTIRIDNSIIDISISNKNDIPSNLGFQLSPKGEYMIYEMEYTLQNRGNAFSLRLNCKNRERISKLVGK